LAVGALLLGACVGPEENGAPGAGEVVVEDAIDPTAGDVSVKISVNQAAVPAGESPFVTVSFTNNARHAVKLLSMYTAAEELEEDLFVVSLEGKPIEYIGPHYKRLAAEKDDFVVLAPGKTLTRDVSIERFYDLSQTGDYTIQYAADLSAQNVEQVVSLASSPVNLWIEGRANPVIDGTAGAVPAEGSSFLTSSVSLVKCTTTQANTVMSALNAASNMANDSTTYLSGSPTASARYTTWFGAFSSSGWSTAKSHFVAIKDALDTKPLTVNCGCKKNYYAYVYPNQPYVMYVCNAFWSAPLTGTDSKGGTLIHELSHFTAVAGTDDYVYGQSGAKSLASSNPSQALFNADNHEYFAENTPFLQ
jgi:peptidyl-Lys metalloendopeptidase